MRIEDLKGNGFPKPTIMDYVSFNLRPTSVSSFLWRAKGILERERKESWIKVVSGITDLAKEIIRIKSLDTGCIRKEYQRWKWKRKSLVTAGKTWQLNETFLRKQLLGHEEKRTKRRMDCNVGSSLLRFLISYSGEVFLVVQSPPDVCFLFSLAGERNPSHGMSANL